MIEACAHYEIVETPHGSKYVASRCINCGNEREYPASWQGLLDASLGKGPKKILKPRSSQLNRPLIEIYVPEPKFVPEDFGIRSEV